MIILIFRKEAKNKMPKNIKEKLEAIEDKIKKVDEKILCEENNIKNSKLKIKKLKSAKAKLAKDLQNIKYYELKDALQGFGVKSVDDLNKFLDDYANSEKS